MRRTAEFRRAKAAKAKAAAARTAKLWGWNPNPRTIGILTSTGCRPKSGDTNREIFGASRQERRADIDAAQQISEASQP